MMEIYEILENASKLLNKPGRWTKGSYARKRDGKSVKAKNTDASCYCLLGACSKVSRQAQEEIDARLDSVLGVALEKISGRESNIKAHE